MDTWLDKGDHKTDSRGLPLAISGDLEWVQQVMIRLCVPRGSFLLDRELGSQLYRLNPLQPKATLEEQALLYAKQALMPMAEARVLGVQCSGTQREGLLITVNLEKDGRQAQVTVPVQ